MINNTKNYFIIKSILFIAKLFQADLFRYNNKNESFHTLKAHLLPKNYYFGKTCYTRLIIVILQYYNSNIDWLTELYTELNLPVQDISQLDNYKIRIDAIFQFFSQDIINDAFWREKQHHNKIMKKEREAVRRDRLNRIPLHE